MCEPLLTVTPKSCLQDEKIILKVTGLVPDRDGTIDTSHNESYGGHYKGVFQMGLLAGLKPAPDEYQYLRIFKRDVENPDEIEFRLYENFITAEEVFASSFLVNVFHSRYFMGPGVEKIPIRGRRIRATLFIPAGEGPFPGVVDMFGTAGGLLEYRSAQLASRGVASLALAYFGYDDLPKNLEELDLEYFKEGVHVLLSHKKVKKPHIGVIGVSKGADVALIMATFIPEVKCAIGINGCISNLISPFRVTNDYIIPPLPFMYENIKLVNKTDLVINDGYADPEDYPETIVPIYKSDSKFLFIIGEDDMSVHSRRYAEISAKLLREANKEKNYKICSYKGAGHLLEPPYSPLCFSSYHKVYDIVLLYGGEIKKHTEAQEKSWVEILNVIKENLDNVESKFADRDGTIDTSHNESYGGHYKGVFQMGLLAGLKPAPDEFQYLRLFKRDVENPNEIEFRLYENFLTVEEIFTLSFLVNVIHYRYFMGPEVEKILIKGRRVRASLFIPAGEGPFPGVVDMFGAIGGLLEYRSAQLASRGIASLALAFFGYDDLPESMEEFDLEYFKEAVNILLSHKKVKKPYVGAIGVSKGADLALAMATFIPEVKCVIGINGCISSVNSPFRVTNDYIIQPLPFVFKNVKVFENIGFCFNESHAEPEDFPETIIPIYRSNAKFLFIICAYEGAGHLIEPPYSPLCFWSYHKTYDSVFVWGGEIKKHTEAQEKSWVEIISFIKENLHALQSKL
ncbi:Bile acid-CoA:amino acid N-acyltransferase, partial [Armadillidium vulgare]